MTRLVLYAPNVNTGGGLTLLQELLLLPQAGEFRAFLDARARAKVRCPDSATVTWVEPTAGDRLKGEYLLARESRPGDTVLCFHGLPPLMRNKGRIVVFQQNRNYLGLNKLSEFALRTRLRLLMERIIARVFRFRVACYVVQTPSMRRALLSWHGGKPDVRVCPFVGQQWPVEASAREAARRWDFIYVADGVAHKNHRRLLEAWSLLASEGLRPALALTLGDRDRTLVAEIDEMVERSGLRVENLGEMSHEDLFRAYQQSAALIFPSTSESFGLPLIEAGQSGLPVVASERDFVRDVCSPSQTFDPESAVSIARAVKRFLGVDEPRVVLQSPQRFLDEVLAR